MRRHTIGLIPSSQTLTCAISAASASAADEAVSKTDLVRFGARVTRPAYRRSPFPVAGTPDILMLSDDPIHGHQEGRFFHGYYDGYCYLPLYVFCGRHLLAAKLRRANIDA